MNRHRTKASSPARGEAPGRVRIIGGRLRGSRLAVPVLPGLRPTPDRVRETVFNWLMGRLEGERVLDLCAGTGAFALEAISRGAASAVLVERDAAQAARIRADIARLCPTAAEVVAADALRWLVDTVPVAPFGLVFIDPPYALGGREALLESLARSGWLKPTHAIYLEWPRELAAPQPRAPHRWLKRAEAGAIAYGLLALEPVAARFFMAPCATPEG